MARRDMPRFVILRHDCPPGYQRDLHWDFMLEADGVLKTWALSQEPAGQSEIAAEMLADHRLAYLDFEGPVSGGRGTVSRWDRGTYRLVSRQEGEWIVELLGERLSGRATLSRSSADEQGWRWQFAAAGPLTGLR
ncbi:MAG TPA: DNA polymerase ligase N-terminal domain-containing protein [Pirellulales bacterium]|nr:DNA polymerase ligase N-terminal domain-containing protein [Pirellulales bacterium]